MRENEPLFVISVAAKLLSVHPQTLRKYERAGFVIPSRTDGNLRLYSQEDIEQLQQVKYLVKRQGVNLSGVEMALEVTDLVRSIQHELRSARRKDYDRVVAALNDVLEVIGATPTETSTE